MWLHVFLFDRGQVGAHQYNCLACNFSAFENVISLEILRPLKLHLKQKSHLLNSPLNINI